MTKRYLDSSDNIVVSYSKSKQEQDCSLSNLIKQYNAIDSEYINNTDLKITDINNKINNISDYIDTENKSKYIKSYIDTYGPEIKTGFIKSGIRALNLQATCPFRAFSEIRLGAQSDYNLELGPAAWLRGQVLHKNIRINLL